MSSPGSPSAGFWLLGSLLSLSFATSMVAYNDGTPANLPKCLSISKLLRKEASESLKQFMNTMNNSCTIENLHIPNPNNEKRLTTACITGGSKTSCLETIHEILESYAEDLKYAKSFGSPRLLNTVNDMMKALKVNSKTIKEASDKPSDSYSSLLKRCKVLHIFKQLTETIDRILNFLNSPEPKTSC